MKRVLIALGGGGHGVLVVVEGGTRLQVAAGSFAGY
jgi:hypothetical protein